MSAQRKKRKATPPPPVPPETGLDSIEQPNSPQVEVEAVNREPEHGCGEVRILWNTRVLYNLHHYPLHKQLGFIRSLPGRSSDWPMLEVSTSEASRTQLEQFIQLVYEPTVWSTSTPLLDVYALLRLCARFQFDSLQKQCEARLTNAVNLVTYPNCHSTLAVLAPLWEFCCSVKMPAVKAIFLRGVSYCARSDHAATKAALRDFWESMTKDELDHLYSLTSKLP